MYKYENIVRQIVNEIECTISGRWRMGLDRDDLIQEGMIAAWQADLNYDSSRDMAFKSYINICIRWGVYDALRRMDYIPRAARTRSNNGVEGIPFSGNSIGYWEQYFNDICSSDDPEFNSYSYGELIDDLIKCDHAPHQGILTAFACGMSKTEIGVVYGLSCERVRQIVAKRKAKLKQLMRRVKCI